MKLRMRGLAVAVAVATAAGAFVAAPSQAASAARTVTIWSGAADAKSDNQTPIIAAWAKAQGITINTVYKKNVRDEFIKAVPDGKGPDLMVGAHDWTGQLVGAGVVAPVALGGLSNSFSSATKSGFTVNGKLYGMPIYSENIRHINKKHIYHEVLRVIFDHSTSQHSSPLFSDSKWGSASTYKDICVVSSFFFSCKSSGRILFNSIHDRFGSCTIFLDN